MFLRPATWEAFKARWQPERSPLWSGGGVDIAVARLSDTLTRHGAASLSVLGMLYLKAAMSTAAADDAQQTSALLDEADRTAARLGRDGNALWAFGPTNAALHKVAALVSLHEGAQGVAAANSIPRPDRDALSRERRAPHLVDLAARTPKPAKETKRSRCCSAPRPSPRKKSGAAPRSLELVEDLRLLGVGATQGRLCALAQRCGLRT